jgi:hypothetical protein
MQSAFNMQVKGLPGGGLFVFRLIQLTWHQSLTTILDIKREKSLQIIEILYAFLKSEFNYTLKVPQYEI